MATIISGRQSDDQKDDGGDAADRGDEPAVTGWLARQGFPYAHSHDELL
jgi:hypothetical protein